MLFSPFFLHLNIFLCSDISTATTFSANPTYFIKFSAFSWKLVPASRFQHEAEPQKLYSKA
ncbi:hypothetical protein RintRC_4088 [Richelia intracellularis]|nr:hypothetical protein RintRC_4088 [Richelia intracellularis]